MNRAVEQEDRIYRDFGSSDFSDVAMSKSDSLHNHRDAVIKALNQVSIPSNSLRSAIILAGMKRCERVVMNQLRQWRDEKKRGDAEKVEGEGAPEDEDFSNSEHLHDYLRGLE
ncbi:hypothetical protein CLAFUW4_10533 [Fulvia fulva]|uniref:Uncharacterized protein n=1 Tax=Passalora fulva TaxID=5499 RepID=A0A9Q8LER8_PASFU|nr:uncharacterized protein CLAFUR5_05147 [Fulvia fulva]KAK4615847.1 hypothetical protein CLAFUR4_10538 [Fulvia fulva]KAK4616630.1 hypothetical protein CLAFUR0_10541 [Fulvia fulva]UJO16145.1 hypothetical protein CLAFUR5_05147 [Fulvia fulva]WPV19697.1 hypothetical protein CLAFUW4_10533 [Fulvia fulva]WPV34457.1 hypothetical protein CLAFUW7_10535 [Fulvia fulva]